ncbi:MAG: D-hexose-6-phosphate mutarotase [Rhodothermales bacterium]
MDLPGHSLLHADRDGAHVSVALEGGHVVRWCPAFGGEALYLSPLAAEHPARAIRGGVPVIFPQFDDLGPLPRHGFARTAKWQETQPQPDEALALVLTDSAETREHWPHAFRLTLGLAVESPPTSDADGLRLALRVRNVGGEPFAFTAALHTYLRVGDVERVRVEGLGGTRYRDKTADGRRAVQEGPLRVRGPLDSVYERAPDRVVVRDEAAGRLIEVEKSGFEDVVVWNPWREGAAGLVDLPEEDYRRMLCVEAAQVHRPAVVDAGATWEGIQTITVRAR